MNPIHGLQVIGIRYASSRLVGVEERSLNRYLEVGAYERARVPFDYAEPQIDETQPGEDPVTRLGALCGEIATHVAVARRAGKAVLMTGGNCTHAPGVLGGLQDAHGPAARIGLVWLDAHGDFNTPKTTLSGSLGGMPVAVCAGLALPEWREGAHIAAPLPTDHILMADLRNLDPAEAQLIHATGVVVTALAPGNNFQEGVSALARRVDMIYLHIDADILDAAWVPHHRTIEPSGPSMAQVLCAVEGVMATGKVVALAVVSVYFGGESAVDLASGVELVGGALAAWRQRGMPAAR
jgi:arginase